jgi:hypothetical protein
MSPSVLKMDQEINPESWCSLKGNQSLGEPWSYPCSVGKYAAGWPWLLPSVTLFLTRLSSFEDDDNC